MAITQPPHGDRDRQGRDRAGRLRDEHVKASGRDTANPQGELGLRHFTSVYGSARRAFSLVWSTSRPLTVALAVLTLLSGVLPAAVAWVSRHIVDSVVAAAASGSSADRALALQFVALEALVVILIAASQRGLSVCGSLLRALLGQRVNVMILEKTLSLDLPHFEDSEFYDRLSQARRQASQRPLSLVTRTFDVIQNVISLAAYGVILFAFSPWAVLILLGAGVPAFAAEVRFSGQAFRLFRWRSPETRQQYYLETVMAREDYAKEVMLYELGPLLLRRYRDIFERLFVEDRALALRRGVWGWMLGLLATVAFYGAYAWIVVQTAASRITLGQMTMYLMVFRQGQTAVSAALAAIGGLYEDNLYMTNLYEFLDEPVPAVGGTRTNGSVRDDGVRFEHVSFTYPGGDREALHDVTLHLRPGEKLALVGENGSGKTTLIKLLTRLYLPTDGRILLDGVDLREWDEHALRERVGVIFQDFARYQLVVGENIGAGDVAHFDDAERWRRAAEKGTADAFVEQLPEGYQTQLGRWFRGGHELSGGQWQKIALSRAFMRMNADIVVLDEPTAAIDARAEAMIFERFRDLTRDQMAILISHRFSTVRMAEQIVVLHEGRVIEQGSHEELMALAGRYAQLFSLQAAGYR